MIDLGRALAPLEQKRRERMPQRVGGVVPGQPRFPQHLANDLAHMLASGGSPDRVAKTHSSISSQRFLRMRSGPFIRRPRSVFGQLRPHHHRPPMATLRRVHVLALDDGPFDPQGARLKFTSCHCNPNASPRRRPVQAKVRSRGAYGTPTRLVAPRNRARPRWRRCRAAWGVTYNHCGCRLMVPEPSDHVPAVWWNQPSR